MLYADFLDSIVDIFENLVSGSADTNLIFATCLGIITFGMFSVIVNMFK